MPLASGTVLGHYEIVEPLGAGGMGEVYRAKDTRLGRLVAIKVLPELFSRDAERVARFQREAKVLAWLNHPNIAAIHGFDQSNGANFIAMEFVDGETLAKRFRSGPIPVEDALGFMKQVAEALEAAHEIGIMHRDLKPANVMITPDGRVKVLDFGLAKALVGESSQSDIGNSPTITAEHTRPGVVLGTAAYMSPEQARGKPLDKRTDIWSFGCVLYECLTGKHTFSGETASDLIAQILERDPDFDALPANTPVAVRHMLMRCLEKDRRRRLRDIGDAVLDLDEAISTRSWSTAAMSAAQAVPAYERRGVRAKLFAVALVALGAVAGAALWSLTSPAAERPIARVSITFPSHMKVSRTRISPDGQTLAWTARPRKTGDDAKDKTRIYTRRLDSFDAQPVNGTEGAGDFQFSHDGRWFHFLAPLTLGSDKLRLAKVPVDGSSPPLTLADWRDGWERFLTLPGGDVLVQLDVDKSFVRIPGAGGPASAPVEIDKGDFEAGMDFSQALPRDDAVLLDWYRWGPRGYEMGVAILDLDTGVARILFENGGH
ncbi:MAG: serine/threonine protein kinase, partial [Planctomycetes bacterium]|nr:serine/threonine protein kinase [Planctomycetota bacterium]